MQLQSHKFGFPRQHALVGLWFGCLLAGCGGNSQHDPALVFGGSSSGGTRTTGASSSGQTAAGTSAAEGGTGNAGSGGSGPAAGGTGAGGAGGTELGGDTSMGGDTDAGGAGPDVTTAWPSFGCGKPFTGLDGVPLKLSTQGTKDANCADKLNGVPKCGAWSVEREYMLHLPANYDATKAYPLVFEAPGCSGNAGGVYDLPGLKDRAIRVGLTPPPKSIGHGTNPDQGCFDDKEGDDSVDFVFYETLYDQLNATLCFDRNQVLAVGTSSGAWLANELGCKYAGDAHGRPIRGIVTNGGNLPTQPEFAPTCTTQPLAGVWVYNVSDELGSNVRPVYAIQRAMKVNGCVATSFDTAIFENFPIGGGNAEATCQRITDCNADFPLVTCALPGVPRTDNASVLQPAADTWSRLLEPR